jgi:hypothetical protein
LYAKKHLLGAKYSFTPAISVDNNQLTSLGVIGSMTDPYYSLGNAKLFAGNTLWETGLYAGYYGDGQQSNTFISKSSNPFEDTYDKWNEELKAINSGYSIIPEFRISDHIDFYLKEQNGNFLSNNSNLFDIFGVCSITASTTAPSSSNDAEFYNVYSTSDLFESLEDAFETLDTKQALITATDLKLKLKVLKKFIPYDGFYPAERTVEMATQFSKSYGSYILSKGADTSSLSSLDKSAGIRSLYSTLFAPGVLYNTIKSGIAVDYPVFTDVSNIERIQVRNANITGNVPNQMTSSVGALTGYYLLGTGSKGIGGFDYRVPFEAIASPARYISNISFIEMESHPSSNLNLTSSWDGNGDSLYELMANNFLAEVPNFFLQDGEMTSLISQPQSTFREFEPGKTYNMRVKLRRSLNVARVFDTNYATPQNNFKQVFGVITPQLSETLTMYSRPSAFGPPMASRRYADSGSFLSSLTTDALNAYNLAFTPPYYDGESWADISFTATSTTHTLDQIFGSSSVTYWRVDSSSNWPVGTLYDTTPYGTYANNFAMQLSASINLLGKQSVRSVEYDASGNPTIIKDDKIAKDQVWIIQTKFETPILNFNESIDSSTMTIPTYGSESATRGMWHQFGKVPTDPNVGIFLEVNSIEKEWLDNRAANDPTLSQIYGSGSANARSLLDVVPFRKKATKLGKLAESRTVYEAVVAVPFLERNGQKEFFKLNPDLVRTAVSIVESPNYSLGPTEVKPGNSLIDLVSKMKKFVLPPTFDFFTNRGVVPNSMFIFEFSHTFSRDDLSYMWQNLSPVADQAIEIEQEVLLTNLADTELFTQISAGGENPLRNTDLKWMIFKVKQKALTSYYDKVLADSLKPDQRFNEVEVKIGASNSSNFTNKYSYNWPYDNFSFIEFGKLNVEVIAKPKQSNTK